MHAVAVRILHPQPPADAGELTRSLADARAANADRLADLFRTAGAADVRIEGDVGEGGTFGGRLRALIHDLGPSDGLVVLGSGSIPMAGRRFAGELVGVAGSGKKLALANSFYSADVVAVGLAANLAAVPDLPSDNALPRWLEEATGYRVGDVRQRWRLAIDLDSPLDVLLVGGSLDPRLGALAADRVARLREVASDRTAELVVAGRSSAAVLRWLERRTESRTRALIEERGLRAIGLPEPGVAVRPPRSVLGLVLDHRGPRSLGPALAELGDGAIVDSRVLLAHRLGPDEAAWPSVEDRAASDLLLPDRIDDSWLRRLTLSARDAAIPVLLGGHTAVGPALRLLLRRP